VDAAREIATGRPVVTRHEVDSLKRHPLAGRDIAGQTVTGKQARKLVPDAGPQPSSVDRPEAAEDKLVDLNRVPHDQPLSSPLVSGR